MYKLKLISVMVLLSFLFQCLCPALVWARDHSSEIQNDEDYKFHFSQLPEHLWNDTKETFLGWPGLIFVGAVGTSLAFLPVDHSISNHLKGNMTFSTSFDDAVGTVFSPYTVGGASLLAFLVATQTRDGKFLLATESLCESFGITMALTLGAKYAIGRTRPNGANYGMPSAHTAALFSTAMVLTRNYGLAAGIPAYAVASLTAFSRIDNQSHYLTDVLIGAVLGSAVGYGTTSFHKHAFKKFLIVPQVSQNDSKLLFVGSF